MIDSSLTRAGLCLKRCCQSAIVGGASILWRHNIEQLDLRQEETYKKIKKKTLDGFLSFYDGCVQALPTHISVQSTVKVHVPLYDPFKLNVGLDIVFLTTYQRSSDPWILTCSRNRVSWHLYEPDFHSGEKHKANLSVNALYKYNIGLNPGDHLYQC